MTSQWKKSLYTYVLYDHKKVILYNTNTKTMAYSYKIDDINTLLSGKDCGDNELKIKMFDHGFLVPIEVDETSEAMLKYYEQIFDRSLSLTLMPTEQCNFRCQYCYELFEKGRMNDNIVQGIYKYLQRSISSYSRLKISWFGGEPLLAMDVIENLSNKIIELCQKTHTPFSSEMTTNGYLLTAETVKKLIKCRVLNYQITLDGAKNIHDKYRVLASGAPTYDIILNNLCEIRDTIKSSMISIIIRVNVTKESMRNLDLFIDTMEKEFGNDKRFRLFLHPVDNWGGKKINEISNSLFDESISIYECILKRERITPFVSEIYEDLITKGLCYAVKRNNYIIGSDGAIYKCTVNFNNDINRVGHVQPNGTFELDYRKLAAWVLPTHGLSDCSKCAFMQYCTDGQCPVNKIKNELDSEFVWNCEYKRMTIEPIIKMLYTAGYKENIKF